MNSPSPIVMFIDGDFTAPSSGSHARFTEMVNWACSVSTNVCVYSYLQHPTAPWSEVAQARFRTKFPGAALYLDPYPTALRFVTSARNLALMIAPSKARAILSSSVLKANPTLTRLMADPRSTLIVNFVDGLTRLDGVPLDRTLVDTHDVKWIRYSKLRGLAFWSIKSLARLRAEVAMLSSVTGVIAISSFEASLFRSLLPGVETLFVPSLPSALIANTNESVKDIDVLFVGSAWMFNVTGIIDFLDTQRQRLGHLRIAIAGKVGMDDGVRKAAGLWPNVVLLGFVDDLADLYARSKTVISPVHGTGLNIKVVEALAHGKPVFASEATRSSLPPGYDGAVMAIDSAELEAVIADDKYLKRTEALAATYSEALQNTPDVKTLHLRLAG